ncbi:tRNA (N(6)-L-threonylcarbamoyladenosine(37)-C(2))-methylthiotransferase [bacterium]|nr:tRNA (N(6)-L-threonylcarbamoyladenosine(37)-C(2))-methylthiotransferase [bacterium]
MVAKFYLETYGCKLNHADSDIIEGILSKDFKKSGPKDADFFIINSCGVIKKTEAKIMKRMSELKRQKKKIILAGCLPQISDQKNLFSIADGAIGPENLLDIKKVASSVLAGKRTFLLKKDKVDKSRYFKFNEAKRPTKDDVSAIVAISDGCLGNCSYCASKFARGELKSFDAENILEYIRHLAGNGFKEIQLTSQDTAAYGLENGQQSFATLLEKITEIKGNFKIRVGMMNPGSVKQILDDLISAYKNEKVYKYLHLPIQSGDDEILKKMRRPYNTKEIVAMIDKFRESFPDFLFATDIIIGFPGESEKSFTKTLEFVKKIRPHIINITKFSLRPRTEASSFAQIPEQIKSKRAKKLIEISKIIRDKDNRRFVDKTFNVLVVKKGKNNTFIARNESFKAIILKKGIVGSESKAKITGYKTNYLIGSLI